MAEAITIACPECDKKLTVAAAAVGKKVRCKGCEHVFVVAAPAAKKAAPAKAPAADPKKKPPDAKAGKAKPAKPQVDDDDEENSNPYGVTSLDTAPRCPDCANEMEEGAVICLHCGYNTQTRQQFSTRKVHDTTAGDRILWLLPGILCVLAIILLIVADIFYVTKMQDLVEGEWYDFVGGGAFKLWFVIFSLFGMFFAGMFAVKRLLIDNVPPEVEKKK
jgi:hypothetical protein